MAGRRYPSIQEFASAIPNHLLLGSLLEHLCFVYESNPARSRMLFKGMYWVLELTASVKSLNTCLIFCPYVTLCKVFWDYCLLLIPNWVTNYFVVPLPDSHWPAFIRHEPPLTFGHKRWVQHRQTPAQPSLHWAASCCQLLAVSTGN